ncbi:Gfo/Idh/MocA family protein [Phycisphaerales bacterium AB-hyl4]|uniref:Gfo/Idh/MocA family protein n=1 Tax=Natronomicrosphaera hydrolytica TaxID=3242702 RepID=A0ABV4U7L0_9BACT
MALKIAIAGLRHGHIMQVVKLAQDTQGVELIACGEDHEPTRTAMAEQVSITHDNVMQMIDEVDCDIVAIGDYYGRRGALAITALQRGRHVLSDKPLTTSLAELKQIADLAEASGLAVGCQLDMPELPNFVRLRELVQGGSLGRVHQIAFGGQHPLMYGTRPGWYFEPGKHGGTINDIAVHAIHLIPWMTGVEIDRVVAARTWNAFAEAVPHFKDSAQLMLRLSDGAGVVGDVSYAMPRELGYKLAQYWRFSVYGSEGMAETSATADHVTLVRHDDDKPQLLEGLAPKQPSYFESFLSEVRGEKDQAAITTADVLRTSAKALQIQAFADEQGDSAGQALGWPM